MRNNGAAWTKFPITHTHTHRERERQRERETERERDRERDREGRAGRTAGIEKQADERNDRVSACVCG